MLTKAFPSKITMLQDLAKRVEGLDVNASAFFPKFSFVTTKGETYMCPVAITFVQEFNKAFGDILDPEGCRTVGGGRGKCILTFLDKVVEVETPKVAHKTTPVEKPKPKAKPVPKKGTTVKEK